MGELKNGEMKSGGIGTDGSIKGECGTSKNKEPDRCLSQKHVLPKPKEPRPLERKNRKEVVKDSLL